MVETHSLQRVLRDRTKKFACDVIRLIGEASSAQVSRVLTNQLLRSVTSVAANYRACGRARSQRDFVSRIGVVLEEADESQFWIEMLEEAGVFDRPRLQPLLKEAGELVLIFSASQATATKRRRVSPPVPRRAPDS